MFLVANVQQWRKIATLCVVRGALVRGRSNPLGAVEAAEPGQEGCAAVGARSTI